MSNISKEVIEELMNTEKSTDDAFKNSNYYREYIDKVCQKLKEETQNN